MPQKDISLTRDYKPGASMVFGLSDMLMELCSELTLISPVSETSLKNVEYHSLCARRKIGHPSLAILTRFALKTGLTAL